MSDAWKAIGELVTSRASVMTPLLILNALLLIFGSALVISKDNYFLLIIWVFVLLFTVYWYARFAKNQPWLLSSQKVAMHGMNLYGDDNNKLTAQEIIDVAPVSKPGSQKLAKGEK